jgi:SAM-dependent methyltransferase
MRTRRETTRNTFDYAPSFDSGGSVKHQHRPAQAPSEKWERFAQEDPYTYILTSLKGADTQEFWRSGERTVGQELLPLVQARGVRPGLALEVGCGIGRLVVPLARHFREVVGVDIAPGMIQRAVRFAADNSIKNVSFAPISGPEDFLRQAGKYAGRCDLIYSLLVFQHVPDFSMIEGYLHVTSALLNEQGLAYVQFDTRPANLPYRVKTRLPDFLLPRFWRRGIRRIRRSPQEIEACIQRAGMEIVGELNPYSAYHRYILRVRQREVDSR